MPHAANSPQRQGIQVISRAAAVLRSLEGIPQGLSLGEIAQKVALPRSTVQRIVYALAHEGFVISATPNARVRLGPALVPLGIAAKVDIDRLIIPHMQAMSEEIQETVDLSVLQTDMMVFIEQVTAENRALRAVSSVGKAFPIHSCANGKAILAILSEDQRGKSLDNAINAVITAAAKKKEKLYAELEHIRKTGIAYDKEEHNEGICAVGIALTDPYGRNIALSVPVPSVRFYKNEQLLVKTLFKYKGIIEAAIGGTPLSQKQSN